jgi:tetratricopeptide (TPR) repeat protein
MRGYADVQMIKSLSTLKGFFYIHLLNTDMKLNLTALTLILSVFFSGCTQAQTVCDESINTLPMYGNAKKCKEQIAADKLFIAEIDKAYPNRKDGVDALVKRGWDYVYAKDLETAMKRFNQAWMLDSLNANVYWGFADLLGMQGKNAESVKFFKKAIKLNPNNSKIYKDASVAYGGLFMATHDKAHLNNAIDALKAAVRLQPGDAQTYSQLTSAYTYFTQKDSALKYLNITDQLDPKAINPQIREMIIKK